MLLRRALCVSASLTIALRHTRCRTHVRRRITTTTSSSTTTLLGDCVAAAAAEVPLTTVEDMFGFMEEDYENDNKSQPNSGTALHVTSSPRIFGDMSFFEWLDDDSDAGGGGAGGDLCLENVMNAALGEPSASDGDGSAEKDIESNDVISGGSSHAALDDDGGDCDDGGGLRALSYTKGDLDQMNAEYNNTTSNDDDVHDDDVSTIAAAEEEDQVERLLRAAETSEPAVALFFAGKQQAGRRVAARLSFDDAAAEGAELETVGEVMPSPKRV